MTETAIMITGKCAEGHSQDIFIDSALGLEYAKSLAGLLDGTSPVFISSPRGTDSMIGKCGICGSQIDCTVQDSVDRAARQLTDGSPVPDDQSHTELKDDGQQRGYVVLSAEERAKGLVRPVRRSYIHAGPLTVMESDDGSTFTQRLGGCGTRTSMGIAIAETYARDPKFYSGTFCCGCGKHLPLNEFVWDGTEEEVGS